MPVAKSYLQEDWAIVALGFLIIILSLAGVVVAMPVYKWGNAAELTGNVLSGANLLKIGAQFIYVILFALLGSFLTGKSLKNTLLVFPAVFVLTTLALIVAGNTTMDELGLEAVIFSLIIGLLIAGLVVWRMVPAQPVPEPQAAEPATKVIVAPPVATDPASLSARQQMLAAELSTLEQRTAVITGEAANSYGNATRAEGMMIAFAARRRTEAPRDDLTTLVLESDFAGTPMSDVDFGSFFVQLVTAGNDTTKTMLSSGLWALVNHPDQLAELRADPSLIPGAVEEILRWANPLHAFRRTATRDVELGGVGIAEGDKVAMVYTSANRDEAVFDDPQRFDIHRSPNPHLSFGIGEHFCLGVHLARLEGRVFFSELLAAFSDLSLAGDPVRWRSNLNNGFRELPVRLAGYHPPTD